MNFKTILDGEINEKEKQKSARIFFTKRKQEREREKCKQKREERDEIKRIVLLAINVTTTQN